MMMYLNPYHTHAHVHTHTPYAANEPYSQHIC